MITVVNYGVGNIASLLNMLDDVEADFEVSGNPKIVAQARKIILPGVGAFGPAMETLNSTGLAESIRTAVAYGVPILGVCLGMQLLARTSEESDTVGLGLIAADVKRIVPSHPSIKVPNMGWRNIEYHRESWMSPSAVIFAERFYFAHSFHVVCDNQHDVTATMNYDGRKTAALSSNTIHGVQYHPEKSHRFGKRLLYDFAKIKAT